MAETPVERGGYLVNTLMTCQNCHTPIGPNGPQFDKALSGGLTFDEPPFKVTASNITPDPETGIGKWTDAQIKTLLRTGVGRNGVKIAPIMPTGFYEMLTERDVDAIVAYLRTVKPIKNEVPAPVYKLPFERQVFPGAEKPMPEADLADKVKRGFYLATAAHCMECHTPRNRGVADFANDLGKGGFEFPGPVGRLGVAQHHVEQGQGDRRVDRRRGQARHHPGHRARRYEAQAADGLSVLCPHDARRSRRDRRLAADGAGQGIGVQKGRDRARNRPSNASARPLYLVGRIWRRDMALMRALPRWRGCWFSAVCRGARAQDRVVPASPDQIRLSYAPVARRVSPSVVNVYAAKTVAVRNPLFEDPLFRRFFGGPGGPGGRRCSARSARASSSMPAGWW